MVVRFALLFALIVSASGCALPDPVTAQAETDPAVALAVLAPILTDPELVSLDKRFAVMADPGSLDASLPPDDFAPQTIAAARAEVAGMMAGAPLPAVVAGGACRGCNGALLAQRARVLGPECAANLDEDLAWVLRLPDDLPIYPKAHLREAVGGEGGACRLHGASFTAPVPGGQVLAFYRAMAAKAGFGLRQAGQDGLIGTRGTNRMAVLVRPLPGGLSQFDLLVAP